MATIKSYTDIEQSRKLNKILPLGSADMYYCYVMDIYTKKWDYDITPKFIDASNQIDICDIPCWSLAALLSVIKPVNDNTYTLRGTLDGGAMISFEEVTNVMFQEGEIIDACYEMILKLHELELL